MPLVFAATAKTALVIGASLGLLAALISNDKIAELGAEALESGANYLRSHLQNKKYGLCKTVTVKDNIYYNDNRESTSEVTTPDATDDEIDDEHTVTRYCYPADEIALRSSGLKASSQDTLSIRKVLD